MSFALQLTALRHRARLTQEQLADRSGLSVRAISSLECGDRHPRRLTVERLATGLGLPPWERRQLIDEAAGNRRPAPIEAPEPVLPMIGREPDLAVSGQLVLYLGEPGVGKTRLLGEVALRASYEGSTVLSAACGRGGDPYAPVVDALAAHARGLPGMEPFPHLELLLPELGEAPAIPAEQRRRLAFDAAVRFVRAALPAVLVLDDVQWAGPAAAELISHLVRRLSPDLRVVLAARAGEVTPTGRLAECVADLARLGLARRHELAPLPGDEAGRLVDTVAAGAVVPKTEILRRSAGLPLFLVELTRAAEAEEAVPPHLRMAIRQQLACLPPAAFSLLHQIALGDEVTPLEDLHPEPSQSWESVLDALDAAVRHRILDETADGFGFRHPLVREVVELSLGPARRRLIRQQFIRR